MKISKLVLVGFLSILVSFCSKETMEENDLTANRIYEGPPPSSTTECLNVDLMAGQHHDAGDFTITKDAVGNLILRYETTGDWELNAVHLYAGDCNAIPTTGAGNPKIGHFPIKEDLPDGTTVFEYTIITNGTTFCGCIAAHAEVTRPGQSETAWAAGVGFPGNSWAMFIEFCGC